MRKTRDRRFLGLAVGLILVGSLAACGGNGSNADGAAKSKGTVYFLEPGQTSTRWKQFDGPLIKRELEKRGYGFKMLDAGLDPAKQQSQMESAIASGAVGAIVTTPEATQSIGTVSVANAADIPVVGYVDDMVGLPDGSLAGYIGTDLNESSKPWRDSVLEEVAAKGSTPQKPFRIAMVWGTPGPIADAVDGQWKDMLKDQLASGQIKIVCRDFGDYTADAAQKITEQCLTKTSNGVDGVITLNDDQAGGVFAALKDQNLTDDVKIYGGYDATLEGVQRVLAGYQKLTSHPDYAKAARSAVEVLVAAIEKKDPPAILDGWYLKGLSVAKGTKGAIPAVFIGNEVVTPDNVDQTIVKQGIFYTKKELCTGMAASSDYCKGT